MSALTVLFVCSFSAADAQLKADFTADIRNGCSSITVQFTDKSTGSPTNWKWDFSDENGSSTKQNPQRTFSKPGTYTITLTIKDSTTNKGDKIVKKAYITVYNKPDVYFTVNPTSGCLPLNVHFTDHSKARSGKIKNWQWDFGDGDGSSDTDPNHTYKKAGPFDVKLVVTNSGGCTGFHTKNAEVRVQERIKADFTAKQIFSCDASLKARFNANVSSIQPVTYHWNFGDGNTTTGVSPIHAYDSPGSYTVTLTASVPNGCGDTVVHEISIQVGSFHSDFTLPNGWCAGTPLILNNTSTPPDSSVWQFGDGAVYRGINAVYQFKTAGDLTVKLVNFYGECKDSVTHILNVFSSPKADFDLTTPKPGCGKPTSVTFSNNSNGFTSSEWDFGDGTGSTEPNPTHSYTQSGSPYVTLTVKNEQGCTSNIQKEVNVNVWNPEVNFSAPKTSGCVPLKVQFTPRVSNTDPILKYLWDFGDNDTSAVPKPSHKYADTGTYDVKLKVVTAHCVDSIVQKKYIQVVDSPKIEFTASFDTACLNTPIQFTNNSGLQDANWTWYFPDDYSYEFAENPFHQFSHLGKQDVILKVDYKGCIVKLIEKGLITIKPPTANFEVSQSCEKPYTVTFTDESLQATGWHWDFGDGKQSDVQNPPPHKYAATGTYKVTLRTKNGECSSDTSIMINVIDLHPVLNVGDSIICRGTVTNFSLQNTGDVHWIRSYTWIMGNGVIYTTVYPNISFRYTKNGTYNAQLITTDINGCRDTSTIVTITVEGPMADFQLSPPNSCTGNKVTFKDNSTTTGSPIQKWNWSFGDGSTETLAKDSVVHTYTEDGQYNVQLRVTDQNGCSDQISHFDAVSVFSASADFSTLDTLTCPGSPITWINNSRGNNLTYQWNFGDSTGSNQENPVKTYTKEGIYPVSLKVKTNIGCKDSVLKTKYIRVAAPYAQWSYKDNNVTCPPFIINVVNESKNYKKIFWDFGDGATSDNTNEVTHVYTMGGTYRLRMLVYGYGEGCIDSMIKMVEVNGPSGRTSIIDSIGCSPHAVQFSATSNNTVSYQWDFSDGNVSDPSATDGITHTYKHEGIFQPRLILADRLGCKVAIPTRQKVRIDETKIDPLVTLPEICDSTLRKFQLEGSIFTKDSLDLPVNYQWDFGDPGSANNHSTSMSPQHDYAVPGEYTANVLVKTVYGCNVQKKVAITIPKPYVMQVVTSPDTIICKGSAAKLRAGGAYRYVWTPTTDMNDADSASPIAKPGTTTIYQVIGYAKGNCQIDTAYDKVIVKDLPKAVISTIDTLICPGTPITWVNKSVGNNLIYLWNFGDRSGSSDEIPSKSFREEGVYSVSLKVKTEIGCQDSIVQENYIRVGEPHAKWSYADSNASCLPLVVSITNHATNYRKILWNFGDETTSNDTNRVRHAYNIPGTYRLSMLVYGYSEDCRDSIVKMVVVKGPYGKPKIMDSIGCSPFIVQFSAAATNTISYQWDFGDSTLSSPSVTDKITHTYKHGGIFQPSLKLTDRNGCQLIIPTRHKIKVDEINITPWVTFPDICDSSIREFQVRGSIFTKDSLNLPVNYQWNFGDPASVDNISTSLNPRHNYSAPGSYPVKDNVETAYGCNTKDTVDVIISRPYIMKVKASPDTTICKGTSTTIRASGATRYVWTPAVRLNNGENAAPIALPDATTTYQVVGYSIGDCQSDTANVQIFVKNHPQITLPTDTTIGTGSIFLLPVSYSPDAINWRWAPALYLDCAQCAVPTSTPHESITYKVITANQWGCADTASIKIKLACKEGKVFIPNTFTPNNDGRNDIFYPRGRGVKLVRYFRIYNRFGQLVYERANFQLNQLSAGWDGTFNGHKLNPDVFVYSASMVCDNNKIFLLKGDITLLR